MRAGMSGGEGRAASGPAMGGRAELGGRHRWKAPMSGEISGGRMACVTSSSTREYFRWPNVKNR
jgi:hypothetical protein